MLKICFVTDHTFLPDRVGGRESSIDQLAAGLVGRGHSVTVIANRGSHWALPRRIIQRLLWKSDYTIVRVANEKIFSDRLLADGLVDVIVYNVLTVADFIYEERAAQCKQVFFIRDIEDDTVTSLAGTACRIVANSKFTARWIKERVGREPFLFYPRVDLERYKVKGAGDAITFVNPIPKKGLEIAIAMAQYMPCSRFIFVMGWEQERTSRNRLLKKLVETPNVEVRKATHDMSEIYRDTRILLVPSICDEAFGRVVIEAQSSGIPVLASDRGGLPEATGSGGILLSVNDDIRKWVSAAELLMRDESMYQKYSLEALNNATIFSELNRAQAEGFQRWLLE